MCFGHHHLTPRGSTGPFKGLFWALRSRYPAELVTLCSRAVSECPIGGAAILPFQLVCFLAAQARFRERPMMELLAVLDSLSSGRDGCGRLGFSRIASHTRGIASHTRGIASHTPGISSHTSGLASHTPGIASHTHGIASQTCSNASHTLG